MKRLITWLVVLAVLAYLAFKAAVWWLTEQQVVALQKALQETSVIERGKIGSSIGGHLVLKGAEYQDFRLTQPLQIGQLRFAAGSPVNLLTSLLNPRNLPPQWTLEAKPLSMALDTAMLSNWVTDSGA
ncbi:MAG: acetylornithine deacetylase, partial [Pseudomonadota bacterium]|nr:acetylornithine deacetylase [Pseudomonadota bacterium]